MPEARGALPTLPPPEFVETGGARIAFYDYGAPHGRPIVICHGLAANALQFAADAEFFAARGYRVLLPDLRGHGQSRAPMRATFTDFALKAMAGDLLAMLDAAGLERVDWVGNSLGGIVALAMIEQNAHRIRSFASFGTVYSMQTPRVFAGLAPLTYRIFGRRLVSWVAARATTRDPKARVLVEHILNTFDPGVLDPILTNLRSYDFREAARRFPGRMLMLRGGRDVAVNQGLGPTLEAMRGRANFTLVEVPKGGHCANLDATEAVRAALLAHLEAA
ncbi:MAG: alpha/beta fold hydrolase [Cucumibacter sp.]